MKHLRWRTVWSMTMFAPALVAFAWIMTLGTPDAVAYSGSVTNCNSCHSIWTGGAGTGHTGHGAFGSCTSCHASVGDTPVASKCGQCHVVPGVALHHNGTGASSCTGCHGGSAAAENIAPPGYAGTALNPCTDGLDNDGNLFRDGADSACGTVVDPPVDPPTTGVPADHTENVNGTLHKPGKETANGCSSCHGGNLQGGTGPSCLSCHGQLWSTGGGPTGGIPADHKSKIRGALHKSGMKKPFSNGCTSCHGTTLRGGIASSCYKCHGKEWSEKGPTGGSTGGVPADHTSKEDGARHKPGMNKPFTNGCTSCHGANLQGGTGPSCTKCHGKEWSENGSAGGSTGGVPADHTSKQDGARHKPGFKTPVANGCTACHGSDLRGGSGPSCYSCHSKEWK